MQILHGGKTLVSSQVITLQKKAWGIISNQPRNNHSGPLFKNILKFGNIFYKLFKPSYKTDSYGIKPKTY